MPSSYLSVAHEIHPADDPFLVRDHWLMFNRQLSQVAAGLPNEAFLSPEYLCGFEQRMRRVADTIAFLCAWQMTDNQKLYQQIQHAGPADRELIVSNLCRFDGQYFTEMGEDIDRIILRGDHRSRFLKRLPVACKG